MEAIYAIIAIGIMAYIYVTNSDNIPEPIKLRPLDAREIIYSDDEDILLVSNDLKTKDGYFNQVI